MHSETFTEPIEKNPPSDERKFMNIERKNIKVMIAKPGLDGHDRGPRVLCRFLRDSGYEIIYTGLHRTAEEVATAAVQEDVDVLGLSFHSGAHESYVPRIKNLLEKQGANLKEVVFLVGGIIPEEHFGKLLEEGVDGVFIPGAPLEDVSKFIDLKIKEKRKKKDKGHYYLGTSIMQKSK